MKCDKTTTRRLVIALLVLALAGIMATPVFAAEIKIGLITSLTGPVSTYGQSVRNAVQMAVDEINAAGGINGNKINLIVRDDKGDATEAANVTRYFIDREQVALIVGPVITPCVMASAPIAQ
ncbi:MAG: ABC transporter substrate-binding protein [Limnochordia bacterium]